MDKNYYKNIIIFSFLLLLFVVITTLGLVVGPEYMVSVIGVEGGYTLSFFVSLFGGLSMFSSPIFYSVILTLVEGGLSIPLLSIITGIGLTIGDSLMFLLGKKGRTLTSGSNGIFVIPLTNWIKKLPDPLIAILITVYAGLTPFPNDFLMVSLSLGGFSYKKTILPLLIGDIIFVFVVSSIGYIGLSFI